MSKISAQLLITPRCPQCGVASPNLLSVYALQEPRASRPDGRPGRLWKIYQCNSCNLPVIAMGQPGATAGWDTPVTELIPNTPSVSDDLPPQARRYLQQARDALATPDGAAMLAGSAVDAMLKALGLVNGSVYSRIDEATKSGRVTPDMATWAHEVRLGSNRPRHADEDQPHVTSEEAAASVEFADALGYFLFELNARIKRGIKQAAPEAH